MNYTESMIKEADKAMSLLKDKAEPEQMSKIATIEDDLYRSFALSDFVARTFASKPDMLCRIIDSGEFESSDRLQDYATELDALYRDVLDDNTLKRKLRHFRNEKLAVIALRQLCGKSDLAEDFMHLSGLAELIIVKTLDYLYTRCCQTMGTPYSDDGEQQRMLVIGMGKLGGKELNFSSDIDLIFCYPHRGETRGTRRPIDNQVFFTRLGQQLIQILDQQTVDGIVYRVDMRLRPFGDSGPLVSSFAALEDYYLKHGRSWERYAMVKGRVLGEKTPESVELDNMLRPFVYRRYLDFGAIESLRKMKAMIEAEVRRRQLRDNFKLGAGGIREIEFIAQVFQLMRGGRMVPLQERNLLKVLEALKHNNCITSDVYDLLKPCYEFLRYTENVVQEINDEQTQTLPQSELNRERLALAMGCESYDVFYERITSVLEKVHNEFSLLISDPESENAEEDPVFSDLWLLNLSCEEIKEILVKQFKDLSQIDLLAEEIKLFKDECANKPIGPKGRAILNKLIPYLFNSFAMMKHGTATTFKRVAKLLLTICLRTTYMQLLQENPQACDQLLKLCSGSELITAQLTEHPVLLDELLMPNSLYKPTSPNEYSRELHEFMLRVESTDLEHQMESLRQFKQIQLLRICAADLVGALPLMKVSDYLTFLAQAILNEVVNITWNQLVSKYGLPHNAVKHGDKGICVIAYGKLGGIELSYGSDLDLVFLCDGDLEGETDHPERPISDRMFYGRFAQRLMHLFSTRLSSGVLYEVDARLRPEGEAGPLICSITGYESYLHNRAWTWELQALVRARAVLGPERLVSRFNAIRNDVLRKSRDAEKLREEVIAMRVKMRNSLIRGPKEAFDTKQGEGGMTDIEFIAQYLVLANAPLHSDFVLWSDNVRIFEECARLGIISDDDSKCLINAYLDIRAMYHHHSLLGLSRVYDGHKLDEQRKGVIDLWHKLVLKDYVATVQ